VGWGSDYWSGIVFVGAVITGLVLCVLGYDYRFDIVCSGAGFTALLFCVFEH